MSATTQPSQDPARRAGAALGALATGTLAVILALWTHAIWAGSGTAVGVLAVVAFCLALAGARPAGPLSARSRPLWPWLVLLAILVLGLLNGGGILFQNGRERVPAEVIAPSSAWLPGNFAGAAGWVALRRWVVILLLAAVPLLVWPSARERAACALVLGVNAALLAVAGMAVHLIGEERLLGRVEPFNPSFFAAFHYHNFYVSAALLGLGLALHGRAWWGLHQRACKYLLVGLSVGPILMSLPLVRSRMGLLVLAFAVLAILVSLGRAWAAGREAQSRQPLWLAGVLGLGAVAGLGVWLGRAEIEQRLEVTEHQWTALLEGHVSDSRVYLTRDTAAMFAARPLTGWGVGSFSTVFPVFAGEEFYEDRLHEHSRTFGTLVVPSRAHDDWLQLLAELGLIGLGLLVFPLVSAARVTGCGRLRRERGWLLAALGLLGVFMWAEAPLQNPAVALLIGWTWALAVARERGSPKAEGP